MGTPLRILIAFAFLINIIGQTPVAADELTLPAAGQMVHLSPAFNPPVLTGIKINPTNPLQFDFILDKGESTASEGNLKEESTRLIKYFLASMTVPEGDLWVNLSPYEKDRIVPDSFGQTDMGRDLLAQDYLLKQITASLIYPGDELGKKFWNRVYEKAAKQFNTTNIPVNTFNKVWIVPQKAVVYENAKTGTAYVVETYLKVMLEEDYLAEQKNIQRLENTTSTLGSQVVRDLVIPELEKEINEGRNFAQLRQVYHSLILATWYKKKIKTSLLSKIYIDKNKVEGIERSGSLDNQTIYEHYLKAFKKGVYSLIKEEEDPVSHQLIPRKYFSGGFFGARIDRAMSIKEDEATHQKVLDRSKENLVINIKLDPAMSSHEEREYRNLLEELEQYTPKGNHPIALIVSLAKQNIQPDDLFSIKYRGNYVVERRVLHALSAFFNRSIQVNTLQIGRFTFITNIALSQAMTSYDISAQDWYFKAHKSKLYHDIEHSLGVSELAFKSAIKRGLKFKYAKLLEIIGLLHDYDPDRDADTVAWVIRTIKRLRDDWDGKSLDPKFKGSVLKDLLQIDYLEFLMILAIIQRSEFPLWTQNDKYKNLSPLEEYKKLLNEIKKLDPSRKSLRFVLEEGAYFSEYIDKVNGYARKSFDDSVQMVRSYAREINNAGGNQISEDFFLNGTHDFLSKLNVDKDKELALEFGITDIKFLTLDEFLESFPPRKAQQFRNNVRKYGERNAVSKAMISEIVGTITAGIGISIMSEELHKMYTYRKYAGFLKDPRTPLRKVKEALAFCTKSQSKLVNNTVIMSALKKRASFPGPNNIKVNVYILLGLISESLEPFQEALNRDDLSEEDKNIVRLNVYELEAATMSFEEKVDAVNSVLSEIIEYKERSGQGGKVTLNSMGLLSQRLIFDKDPWYSKISENARPKSLNEYEVNRSIIDAHLNKIESESKRVLSLIMTKKVLELNLSLTEAHDVAWNVSNIIFNPAREIDEDEENTEIIKRVSEILESKIPNGFELSMNGNNKLDLVPKDKDSAMGGIDLNKTDEVLQVNEEGEIVFDVDPAMLAEYENFPGFNPVIISIKPLANLPNFL
jgi:hypothetical protein